MTPQTCRHCQRSSIYRRGLCRPCYEQPATRARYGTLLGAYGAAGPTRSNSPLPALATATVPGSDERIRVLAERADRGEALFHPADATLLPAGVDHA